jgi:hypothetical protein
MLIVSLLINLDAAAFKKAFNDAKEFNKSAKAGGELVYAPVIAEKEEDDEDKKKKPETKDDKKEEEQPKDEKKEETK